MPEPRKLCASQGNRPIRVVAIVYTRAIGLDQRNVTGFERRGKSDSVRHGGAERPPFDVLGTKLPARLSDDRCLDLVYKPVLSVGRIELVARQVRWEESVFDRRLERNHDVDSCFS
jgi:hypothetical protein